MRVILLKFNDDEDFDKWDMILWALCRRSMAN